MSNSENLRAIAESYKQKNRICTTFVLGGFRELVGLKSQNPSLKVLISMGGWNEGSYNFSLVARDPKLRKELAQNVVSFIKEYDFDGFDIDWEYPSKRDSIYPDVDPVSSKLCYNTVM